MWGLIVIQIILILLFALFGWAVRFKKAYWLISGFASRPEEEKQQLIENGLPQKTGILLLSTAGAMLLLLPLSFTSFNFVYEVQFGVMLVMLMGGLIFLSKFEIPRKQKRSYIMSTLLFLGVIGTITAISVTSYQGYEMVVTDNHFEITGLYGDEWPINDIKKVEIMDEMPNVTLRTNGIGLPTLSKGHFKVTDYGSSLLFIQKGSSPYLYIELKNKHIFINDKDPVKTKYWFEQLNEKTKVEK